MEEGETPYTWLKVGVSLAAGENPGEGDCSEVCDLGVDLGVEFEGEFLSSLGFFFLGVSDGSVEDTSRG